MKCIKCGFEIIEGQKVCPNCGEEIKIDQNKQQNTNDLVEKSNPSSDTNNQMDDYNQFFEFNETPSQNSSSPEGQTNNNSNVNEEPVKEPVKNKVTSNNNNNNNYIIIIFLTLISIIIVCIAGLITYYKVANTPKRSFKKGLNYVSSALMSVVGSNSSSITNNITISSDNTNSDDNSIFGILSNFDINLDLQRDYSNSILYSDVDIKYKNNQLFKGVFYSSDKDLFINSHDKWIKQSYEEPILNKNSDEINAYRDIINELFMAIDVSLKDNYFASYKETIDIDNKIENVMKNELIIDSSNIKEIEKRFYKYLINSKKYVKALEIFNGEEEDIKKSLQDKLELLNNEQSYLNINKMVFQIYTKGLKNEFYKFVYKEDSYGEDKFSIIKIDNNIYQINLGQNQYNLSITKDKDKKTFIINSINSNNPISLRIDCKKTYNTSIKKPDISNYVDYEQLLADEKTNIINSLIVSDGYNSFTNDINNIIMKFTNLTSNLNNFQYQDNFSSEYDENQNVDNNMNNTTIEESTYYGSGI